MIYFHLEVKMENQISMDDQNTQQIVQNDVSQSMNIPEKPKVNYLMISGVILSCLIVFGLGGYYLGKQSSNKNLVSRANLTQTVSPTPITTADPTTNWKIYNNKDLGFELKYPPSAQIDKELNDQYNRATIFKGGSVHFEVRLRKTGDIILDKYYFMDSSIVRKTTLDNIPANVYELPNGYCDGPSCSEPYIAFVAKYGSDLYHLSFFGDVKMSDEENQILSTFKFLDKPSPTSTTTIPSITIKYSPKTNWQTYTDEIAKFSFQYNINPAQPHNSHQSLGNNEAGKSVMIMGCSTPPNAQDVCLEQYTVTIYSNYNGGSRRDWMSKNINDYSDCQRYYTDVSVAGKNAMISTSDCSSWGETYILIPNGSQMIVFLTEGYSRDNTTDKITLQDWIREALSTFRFI